MPRTVDMTAFEAALYRYAAAYDHFAEQQQIAVASGRDIEASGNGWYAQIALRAYEAELRDPEPRAT